MMDLFDGHFWRSKFEAGADVTEGRGLARQQPHYIGFAAMLNLWLIIKSGRFEKPETLKDG